MRTSIALTVAFALIGSEASNAQETDDGSIAPLSATLATAGPGTIDSPVSDGRSGVELTTATEESRATFKLARTRSGLDGNKGVYDTFAVTASAPLSKSSSSTNIATLSGFANDFSLKFAVSRFVAPGLRRPDFQRADEIVNEAIAACNMKNANAADRIAKCTLDDPVTVIEAYANSRLDEYESLFFDRNAHTYWTYGLEGAVGYKKYDFVLTNIPLGKASETKTPWSLKGFVGILPTDVQALAILGFEYQESYKEVDSGTVCPDPSGTGSVTCFSGPLGAPSKQSKLLTSIELRRLFSKFPVFGSLGVAPRAFYDLKNDDYGFDVPVYFVADAKSALTGGIRFGWLSDKHDMVIGLFVGSAFSLF